MLLNQELFGGKGRQRVVPKLRDYFFSRGCFVAMEVLTLAKLKDYSFLGD